MSLSGTFLSNTALLGVLGVAASTDQTSHSWAILESTTDDVPTADQKYGVAAYLKQEGAGTSRLLVLTSHDGTSWCLAAASSLLTQDGDEIYEILEPTRLLRHVAVATVLTGDPKPGHTYSAVLVSNGRFQLVRTSKVVSASLAAVAAADTETTRTGRATVSDGQSQVDVTFQVPWSSTSYTVAVTPEDEAVASWVSTRTATGFRLHTSAPVDGDTTLHWIAIHD